MKNLIRRTTLSLFMLCGILFFQGCATSGYSLVEPHLYNNSYDQTVTVIQQVLKAENMVIMNAEELDEKTTKIYFFKKSNRIDEQDFETGHTAEIIIKKLGDRRTSVQIEETRERALVRDEYREHLARDVFKGLRENLVLIEKKTG